MHILIKYFILTEIVITNLFYKIVTVSLFHDYLNQVTVFLGSWSNVIGYNR